MVITAIVLAVSGLALLTLLGYLVEEWPKYREKRKQERERRRKEREEEARRHQYYQQQLSLARLMRRTDKEIEEWAKKNYKKILEKEAETLAEVERKLLMWGNYFLSKKGGEEIIDWWKEPLKEIKAAKRFVAQGGEFLAQLEERLQKERLEAEVFKLRQRILKELEERPVIHEVEALEEGRSDGILGKVGRRLRGKD